MSALCRLHCRMLWRLFVGSQTVCQLYVGSMLDLCRIPNGLSAPCRIYVGSVSDPKWSVSSMSGLCRLFGGSANPIMNPPDNLHQTLFGPHARACRGDCQGSYGGVTAQINNSQGAISRRGADGPVPGTSSLPLPSPTPALTAMKVELQISAWEAACPRALRMPFKKESSWSSCVPAPSRSHRCQPVGASAPPRIMIAWPPYNLHELRPQR